MKLWIRIRLGLMVIRMHMYRQLSLEYTREAIKQTQRPERRRLLRRQYLAFMRKKGYRSLEREAFRRLKQNDTR